MPATRAALAEITPNRSRNHELSPYQRALIVGRKLGGQSAREIADAENTPIRTVYATIEKSDYRDDGLSKPRSGRPRNYTEADEQLILNYVRHNPKSTWRQTIQGLNLNIGKSTYKTILRRHHISKWRAAKRPYLQQHHAEARLQFAEERATWSQDIWDTIIWSDECSVERGSGQRSEYVFRTPQQKWDIDKIQTVNKSKDIRIMIWAAFSITGGRSECVIMERDEEAAKNGFTARSYLHVLQEHMPTIYEPGLIFMQDNARIHTAKIIKQYFQESTIELLKHPPYSPDLNPIEHLWRKLKELVHEMHPELLHLTSTSDESYTLLENAIKDAWDAIPQRYFDAVVNSMQRRCQAVISVQGWQTRY